MAIGPISAAAWLLSHGGGDLKLDRNPGPGSGLASHSHSELEMDTNVRKDFTIMDPTEPPVPYDLCGQAPQFQGYLSS